MVHMVKWQCSEKLEGDVWGSFRWYHDLIPLCVRHYFHYFRYSCPNVRQWDNYPSYAQFAPYVGSLNQVISFLCRLLE